MKKRNLKALSVALLLGVVLIPTETYAGRWFGFYDQTSPVNDGSGGCQQVGKRSFRLFGIQIGGSVNDVKPCL